MRTTRSDLESSQNRESSLGTQPIIGVSGDTACKEVQALAPHGSRKKIWGKKNSPLREHVSPSISQTYNKLCGPLENKMREIYFDKEMCFVRSLKFVHDLWLCSCLGLWEVYNKPMHFGNCKKQIWYSTESSTQMTNMKTLLPPPQKKMQLNIYQPTEIQTKSFLSQKQS